MFDSIKKVFKEFIDGMKLIIESHVYFYKLAFLKHPCKKCIVRAACSSRCEKYSKNAEILYSRSMTPFAERWIMVIVEIGVLILLLLYFLSLYLRT